MISMVAMLLDWDPERCSGSIVSYTAAIDAIAESGFFGARWRVDHWRDIPRGSDAWLFLRGRSESELTGLGLPGRGLIGHGTVTSAPYQDECCTDPGDSRWYVNVEFDALLLWEEQIPVPVVAKRIPGVDWDATHGRVLHDSAEEGAIRSLWAEYVQPAGTDPAMPVPGSLPASALRRVAVNRYERDPQAFRECIAHHGTSCAACGFSFEAVYGDIGHGFIQVHHIVPVSLLDASYVLDPISDLVPLCPNCHVMAHRRTPNAYTPAELRRIIARGGYLEGSVVSARELRAQEDAERILRMGTDGQAGSA